MTRMWRKIIACFVLPWCLCVIGESLPAVWIFQQPTYLLEKDMTGISAYTCDPNQPICKVNLDFTSSIPTDEPVTQYACVIDFGFGVTGEEGKCNPDTVEFPTGSWNVHLVVKKIADDTIVSEGNLTVSNISEVIDLTNVSKALEWQSPTYLLLKEDVNLAEYSCDPTKTECKINPKITPLLDGLTSSKLTCDITSDFTIVPSSDPCNPNISTVPTGEHILTIKILDKSQGTLLNTSEIQLKNIPEDKIDPLHVTQTLEWQSPTYLLLLEDTNVAEYVCDSTKSECKINPKITPLLDGIMSTRLACEVTADFPVEQGSDPCNPNTSSVPVGEHVLTIKILEKTTATLLQTRTITLKNTPSQETIDPARVTMTKTWQSPTLLLGLADTSLTEYVCDPDKEECKINPLFTPLLDGLSSSLLTCEVTADFEVIPTTDPCNPNTSVVPTGTHNLTVKILEKSSSVLLQVYTITLNNTPPEIEIIDPARVSLDLVFQQPTYLLPKEDTTLAEYTCDASKPECKINFSLVVKLDGIVSSLLDCQIVTDSGLVMNDCNPDAFLLPVGDHVITISVIQKNSALTVISRTILVHVPQYVGGGGSSSAESSGNLIDLSGALIKVQSGLDAASTCRTALCQVNFEAIVPSGALCQWDFGVGLFETPNTDKKCNPGYVHFPRDSIVHLTVTDPADSTNTVILEYPVFRSTDPIKEDKGFFPKITLQGKLTKSKILTETGILCTVGKNGKCSLNFTAAESVGAKSYFWDFGDGTFSSEKNPLAHDYALGKYMVYLKISNDSYESSLEFFEIEVVKKLPAELEEEKTCEGDCPDFTGKLQISAVMPNPPHADTVEWIEIKNLTKESLSLAGCEISDDSRTYELSEKIAAGKTLRLRQILTDISLGNTKETLTLTCYDTVVDTFSWDFPIPSSYILRREVLEKTPKQGQVVKVVDGDTIDMMIDGKKIRIRLLGVDTPETVHPRKPVEEFGKKASNFTKKMLEGKNVWITYDQDPIDHYGRTLGYIWVCSGTFSEDDCMLFNADLVSKGYARMERRFALIRYDIFDDFEKEAKKNKVGLWSDSEVTKAMNEISGDEKDALALEQEKVYLELQKELLELEPVCENEPCEVLEIPKWSEVTKQLTTFSASAKKSGIVTFSGRSWADFPVKIEVFRGEESVHMINLKSNEVGEYSSDWYPDETGEYSIMLTIAEKEAQGSVFSVLSEVISADVPGPDEVVGPDISDPGLLTLQKTITVETISDHFLSPLTAKIVIQGSTTNNRWGKGDIFYCRSRGSCSINVTADANRKDAVLYHWQLPDGVVLEKNPKSFKVGYGKFPITLEVTDIITGEKVSHTMMIQHGPIPKKTSTRSTGTSKFTLDLKDVPQDIGGGFAPDESSHFLLMSLFTLLVLSATSFALLRKA